MSPRTAIEDTYPDVRFRSGSAVGSDRPAVFRTSPTFSRARKLPSEHLILQPDDQLQNPTRVLNSFKPG